MNPVAAPSIHSDEKRTVAIMQPTFLPWVGYLAMVHASDTFVFLDDVALDHRSWQHRNRIWSAQGPTWLTIPLLTKGRRGQMILDTEVSVEGAPLKKLAGSLLHSYARAKHFSVVFPQVENALATYIPMGLARTNIELVKMFAGWLSIETDFRRSSEMELPDLEKTARLAHICRQLGGTHYLASPGSREYIEAAGPNVWGEITVEYFNYEHPKWKQLGDGPFEPFLSSIDLFMNDLDDASAVMKSGILAS